jgi:uncharacterized membrane protein
MMVDIVDGTNSWWISALHSWIWLMEFNVERGEEMCIYCMFFLPYLKATTFTILLVLVSVSLVSSTSIVLILGGNIIVLS